MLRCRNCAKDFWREVSPFAVEQNTVPPELEPGYVEPRVYVPVDYFMTDDSDEEADESERDAPPADTPSSASDTAPKHEPWTAMEAEKRQCQHSGCETKDWHEGEWRVGWYIPKYVQQRYCSRTCMRLARYQRRKEAEKRTKAEVEVPAVKFPWEKPDYNRHAYEEPYEPTFHKGQEGLEEGLTNE